MMRSFFSNSLFCVLFCLLFAACTSTAPEDSNSFSSQKSEYVDFIASHTSGIISRKSKIQVKLAQTPAGAKAGEKIPEKLFDFEPSVKGLAYWEDEQTIAFEPAESLEDNKQYRVKFLLNKLLETPEEKRSIAFFSR